MNIFEDLSDSIKNGLEKTIENTRISMQKEKNNLSNDEFELAQKLEAIEEFTIDRFEGNIAVLENRLTGKMLNVEKEKLPKNAKEGNILDKINGKYLLNEEKTLEAKDKIKDKMKKLWDN